jgi:hypothetical protein
VRKQVHDASFALADALARDAEATHFLWLEDDTVVHPMLWTEIAPALCACRLTCLRDVMPLGQCGAVSYLMPRSFVERFVTTLESHVEDAKTSPLDFYLNDVQRQHFEREPLWSPLVRHGAGPSSRPGAEIETGDHTHPTTGRAPRPGARGKIFAAWRSAGAGGGGVPTAADVGFWGLARWWLRCLEKKLIARTQIVLW